MMNFLKQEMCFHYVYGHTYQSGAPALTWGCRCYLDKWQLLFWKTWINLEHTHTQKKIKNAAAFTRRSFMAVGEKIMPCWNITCQKRTPRPRIFQGFVWHSVKSYLSGDVFLQQTQVRVPFPANATHNGTTDFEGNKFFPSSCRNCWV